MPCNFGYKSYSKIEISEPQPQNFKTKTEAPKIDAELLTNLGSEDPEFLEWAQSLDTGPLLQEALKRTLAKTKGGGVEFTINDKGMLEAKGEYLSEQEKRRLKELAANVSEYWQFEIIGLVTQLLGYRFTLTQNGREFTLEAEEEGKSHPCDYIKVTKKKGDATLTFEHFKSRKKLQLEAAKFLTLAHRLGIKIVVDRLDVSEGDPLPGEERHGHSHGHHHGGDHDDHN